MEISHRPNILEGFFKCEEKVMSHMKQFNEYFLFLKESMGIIGRTMVKTRKFNKRKHITRK